MAVIYDGIGKNIPVNINFSQSNKVTVDLGNQSNGIYFVMIKYRNETFTKKIALFK